MTDNDLFSAVEHPLARLFEQRVEKLIAEARELGLTSNPDILDYMANHPEVDEVDSIFRAHPDRDWILAALRAQLSAQLNPS